VGKALSVLLLVVACGGNHSNAPDSGGGDAAPTCGLTADQLFPLGDPDGHAQPLGAGPAEARAGRVHAADLPPVPSGLVTWADGDFVIANDRIALVIEDVGDSDLYDPWGGRPVGLARMEDGHMVAPNNFGEVFFLTGRSTVVTTSVTVLADGSDGGTAIIRVRGKLHPLPFFEQVVGPLFRDELTDVEAAIDYELAPGADHVDVRYRYLSPTARQVSQTLHALMYTSRTPVYQPTAGFQDSLGGAPYAALVDDDGTSWAYIPGEGQLGGNISVSGFVGAFADGFAIPACQELDRIHARIEIGDANGVDGVVDAIAHDAGTTLREVSGTVTRDGVAQAGVRVHAEDAETGAYLTRATTDASGHYALHVPENADVTLTAYRRGDQIATGETTGTDADLALPSAGAIHVVATEDGAPVPVRVQVLPAAGQSIPTMPPHFGEPGVTDGRLHVEYATTGEVTVTAPPGAWEVVVSRGYEYELSRQTVTVTAGATSEVEAEMDRSVSTPGELCGDFHIHTWRSNDSGDVALTKVAQAVADGLELPVRSDHEWVGDFSSEIAALGVQKWAAAIGSIELTSFETWGHMGVFPLVPDHTAVNAGAPKWQTFPTAEAPATPFTTIAPPQVFDAVRARPESPLVIINHPRGGANYFTYVGYDPATGLASSAAAWDTKFTLVEVFNDSDWLYNRAQNVEDWLGLLRSGRHVMAVGSSDSHGITTSPVGYPRTCLAVGTDDPRAVTANQVRDTLAAGHAAVAGGVYISAAIGDAKPGDTTTGAGSPMAVDVTVQAATWIDVSAIEVIVDGHTVDTIPIMPGDADPANPVIRWHGSIPVQSQATGGFVVIAAYGTQPMEPVHPGRIPFGVTEPIFVDP
jgi:hypothetical protein